MMVVLGRALAIVGLMLLAACAAPPRPAAPPPPPVLDPDSACLKDLRDHHVVFEPQAPIQAGSCSVSNPVKVSADSQFRWSKPGLVSCAMARSIDRFEADVVTPAARRILGQGVVRLIHMGTYNCRTRRTDTTVAAGGNGESRGGRLSEHAKGQAMDIGGFELADGSVISVKKDWSGAGKRSEFLQTVARTSCDYFNVVLTPNHNRLHADHLHLDIGPHKLCGY